MANYEQFARLRNSIEQWNTWRENNPTIRPDLSFADFSNANLRGAYLMNADLRRVNLNGANLNGTSLSGADLTDADLISTVLSFADLRRTSLRGTILNSAVLSGAIIANTSFGDRELRVVKGLENVRHDGPSPLSINTIYLSQGDIPEAFVRGTGAPDSFLEYMKALASKPIEYYSCFLSYSSHDEAFARRLYDNLQGQNVRCWFAPHDMRIGDEIRSRIDESIRIHDKLLLVLSQHSIESVWVKKEVETAFEKEQQHGKLVLFPVKLDETVMQTEKAWAADIRRMRHIGDFQRWKDHDEYEQAFTRLLRDLKANSNS